MVFGVYAPVRSVPIGRGRAYVKTHRVLGAPSAPGRRLVDGGVSRSRFRLCFSVCDRDSVEHGESEGNGSPLTQPLYGRIPRRRGRNGPPEPFLDHRRGWRGRRPFCNSVRSREAREESMDGSGKSGFTRARNKDVVLASHQLYRASPVLVRYPRLRARATQSRTVW